jgi:hypothetical protein
MYHPFLIQYLFNNITFSFSLNIQSYTDTHFNRPVCKAVAKVTINTAMSVQLCPYLHMEHRKDNKTLGILKKACWHILILFKTENNHRYITSVPKCDHISPYLIFIIDLHYVFLGAQFEVEELVAELHKKNISNFKSPLPGETSTLCCIELQNIKRIQSNTTQLMSCVLGLYFVNLNLPIFVTYKVLV